MYRAGLKLNFLNCEEEGNITEGMRLCKGLIIMMGKRSCSQSLQEFCVMFVGVERLNHVV